MATKPKIKPAAPITRPGRQVEVPSTIKAQDTTQGDDLLVRKTRADFREEEFTRVIRQHGKYVVWRKALLCPCFNPETEQATVNCQLCNQDGYIYVQPTRIQALMFMFDKKTSIYEKFGLYQEGSVNVTVEAKYRLGFRDSLEMEDSIIPMNELLFKNNRRGRRSILPAGVDSARFRIRDVAAMLYQDKAGNVIALEESIHFTITDEGWIRWTPAGNRCIPEGGVFTIHYDFHPIFLVHSWMHVTRDDVSGRKTNPSEDRVIAHPVQAMAKLDFLVNSNGLPSMELTTASPSGFGPSGVPHG